MAGIGNHFTHLSETILTFVPFVASCFSSFATYPVSINSIQLLFNHILYISITELVISFMHLLLLANYFNSGALSTIKLYLIALRTPKTIFSLCGDEAGNKTNCIKC